MLKKRTKESIAVICWPRWQFSANFRVLRVFLLLLQSPSTFSQRNPPTRPCRDRSHRISLLVVQLGLYTFFIQRSVFAQTRSLANYDRSPSRSRINNILHDK